MDLSVIIVNFNTREITREAVASVLACAGTLRIEVIVVDNASTDGSVAALREAFPQVTVIDAGYNGGYAWGNNQGISCARGRYILVLNPDSLMHPGTLEAALSYMEAHPEVGLLGARVLYETGIQQSTLFRDLRLSHLFWRLFIPNHLIRRTSLFGDQRYASKCRSRDMDVEVVAGCFMLVPRRVIEKIGAMDDRFFMYSEESEWCWRVRQSGYRVRYNPEISITHYGAVSTGEISPWKAVEIARGQILFLRFTRGPLVAWTGTAIMALGEILRGSLVLPACLINRKGDRSFEIWKGRMRFLMGALLQQPRGQRPDTWLRAE